MFTRSVNRFVAQFEQSGDVTPKSGHNGPQRLLGEEEQLLLLRLILKNSGKRARVQVTFYHWGQCEYSYCLSNLNPFTGKCVWCMSS